MSADELLRQFRAFEQARAQRHATATYPAVETVVDRSHLFDLQPVDSPLLSRFWGGPFYSSRAWDRDSTLPAVNLVFVQDANGNTGTDEPEQLGGGITDLMIYEVASRVLADAILAGSSTMGGSERGPGIVLSIWHPEAVDLRTRILGKRRHPINVIATEQGDLPIEEGLVYNNPDVDVVILTGDHGKARLEPRMGHRTWVHVESTGAQSSLRLGLKVLRLHYGVQLLSAVGGRNIATKLLDSNLVHDLYLTTTPIVAVPPDPPTPFYLGDQTRLQRTLDLVIRKQVGTTAGQISYDHFVVGPL